MSECLDFGDLSKRAAFLPEGSWAANLEFACTPVAFFIITFSQGYSDEDANPAAGKVACLRAETGDVSKLFNIAGLVPGNTALAEAHRTRDMECDRRTMGSSKTSSSACSRVIGEKLVCRRAVTVVTP